MMKPAITAVYSPRSGVTPLAIAKAIARGRATIPTITPAVRSARSWSRVYVLSVVTSLGMSNEARSRTGTWVTAILS
jgi:hypothetical protein